MAVCTAEIAVLRVEGAVGALSDVREADHRGGITGPIGEVLDIAADLMIRYLVDRAA